MVWQDCGCGRCKAEIPYHAHPGEERSPSGAAPFPGCHVQPSCICLPGGRNDGVRTVGTLGTNMAPVGWSKIISTWTHLL